MKKAIITGTNGFIGSNLKRRIESEFQIVEINEDIFDIDESWREILNDLIVDCDVFFHVGACSNTLEQDVRYMMTRNFESSKIISDICRKKHIPLIFSSSASVYGDSTGTPGNIYAWSKMAAESYIVQNHGVALRYFNVYGPGEESKGKMASIAYQMWRKNLNGDKVSIFPGSPKRDFVYVDDVVDANISAYKNYNLISGWFDVGSGESKTFEDVLNILGIDFDYSSELDIPKGYQFFTCSRESKWLPFWKPKFNLEKGLINYKKYLHERDRFGIF